MPSERPEVRYEEFNVVFVFSCAFEQAEKNVYLEDRVQALQQQNEDLVARIDKNVATSKSVLLCTSWTDHPPESPQTA